MTELFSESSEPPFTRFPLDEFKALFPEGEYRLIGRTIDGARVVGTTVLTHDIPEGPVILTPEHGATVPTEGMRIRWRPALQPEGVEIVGYRVTARAGGSAPHLPRGSPRRRTERPHPGRLPRVPGGVLRGGAGHRCGGGNQTLTSIDITAG